ncbi:recombinase family protein [Streptosporangium canum]|uniref:IS1096 element passenger TnpR family protein n=1 Tax=Streptosporangium canum TaxID=324952 RepID=UPI00342AEB25
MTRVVVMRGRVAVGTIHQLKITLREVHPPVWRRVHVPSEVSLAELHEVIQVAMGWQQHHLHLFGKGDYEYGDNARDETKVTLAGLIPQAGDWLGYRYDFGDCWDHDIEVEKVHRAATKTTYPRCSAGGRACPPEDSGGPEGYVEHLRALRHRKGWKYQVAKSIFGTTRWDPAKWDRAEVNAGLAALAKLWAKQAAAKEKKAKAAAAVVAKASTDLAVPENTRPENGRLRDGETIIVSEGHSPRSDRPETHPETVPLEIEFQDPFRDDGGMSAPTVPAKKTADVLAGTAEATPGISIGSVSAPSEAINAIRIGYARVSTRAQDHLSQMEALAGAHCREVVEETVSTRKDRPKLTATIERMKAGDTLVIYKPDRVARSVKELLIFLEDELAPRGVNLEILSGICAGLHRPNGQTIADKMLFLVAAMAAEMERDLISERTLDGLAAAAAHGRKGGRPPALDDDTLAIARARLARGESVTVIAKHLKVGRSTLYRALEGEDRSPSA